jgi:hypothetical protein
MQITSTSAWLETARFRSAFAKNMLGGPLLADLLSYLSAAVATGLQPAAVRACVLQSCH